MNHERAIIALLAFLVILLMIREAVRPLRGDPPPEDRLDRRLNAQDEIMDSLSGRIDSLGEVVKSIVKILEEEYRKKENDNGV